jgi:hypothetical protein
LNPCFSYLFLLSSFVSYLLLRFLYFLLNSLQQLTPIQTKRERRRGLWSRRGKEDGNGIDGGFVKAGSCGAGLGNGMERRAEMARNRADRGRRRGFWIEQGGAA